MQEKNDGAALYDEVVPLTTYSGTILWLVVGLGLLSGAAIFWQRAGGEWASMGTGGGEPGKVFVVAIVTWLCVFGTYTLLGGVLSLFRINYRIQVTAGELLFSQRRQMRMRISLADIAAVKVEQFPRSPARWLVGIFVNPGFRAGWFGFPKTLIAARLPEVVRLTFVGGRDFVFSSARPAQLVEILEQHSKEAFRRNTLQAAGLSES